MKNFKTSSQNSIQTNKGSKFKNDVVSGAIYAQDVQDNFTDLHPALNSVQASVESSRCLYCFDAPCMTACPTKIDIPKFIRQINTDVADDAAITILSSNILGGTCARACPTEILCEEVCVVNVTEGNPVKIGELQRFAVDGLMVKEAPHPFVRAPLTGIRFAVIGAGPAGLSFAHRFAMLGHDVVIFDKNEKAGGLNEYGLAAYKMVDDFAQREIDFLLDIGGIEIQTGKTLGKDLHIDDLRKEFKGVFIGIGLGVPRQVDISGCDLNGVSNALDFISDLRQSPDVTAFPVGDEVVVIGGGNTAIDAAVQARCLGAKTVTLVYRRGPETMSATRWERELALVNGVSIKYWLSPKQFTGRNDGAEKDALEASKVQTDKVQNVVFETMNMENGKLVATGDLVTIRADMVLKAIGQEMTDGQDIKNRWLDGFETEGGKIAVNDRYQTSITNVYAGGDCIATGDDLTVQAVEDGKQAALAADAMLGKSTQ